VFWKDCVEGAGGVFLCVDKNFNVAEDPLFSADAEVVWVKIVTSGQKLLYLGSFYHPPDNRLYPLLKLQLSLDKITHQQ